jgi:hypothetical protein
VAARHLEKKIVSSQHSAWGGYLAGGALVTELLIKGCDEYITFGWTKNEPGMSTWRSRPVPQPSPLLSEMVIKNAGKVGTPNKNHRTVLLCAGFIYRFPMIYNSALRVDAIHKWVENIENVISDMAKKEIRVCVKMYDGRVASLFEPILQRWLKAGGDFAYEYPDHTHRVRAILNSGKFYEKFDAVVWDIPTGGITEAFACNVRTFSMLSPETAFVMNEAKATLVPLLDSGIIFERSSKLIEGLENMYARPDWYHEQKPNIERFRHSFVRTDKDWPEIWRSFFAKNA